ncbi:hypothetical protein Q5P01_004797 [Channa striata]|uniref:Uncharacterized protein n=1 Tax=Channa striata TaxID=64152 RepID=A0AA88T6N9_CHASR|nr:hypothetical protein Q5P01_004797 [Channa striata]
MEQTSSPGCFLSRRGPAKRGQKSPHSWASSAAPCLLFNEDHVWLEESIGPSSTQSSTSQPSSPSAPSCSPRGSRSSSEGTGSLCSWSSGVEQGGDGNHDGFQAWLCEGRSSSQSHTSAESVRLQLLQEERTQAKLKFSQFLDEVTSNVLHPNCLRAFGRPAAASSSTSISPDNPEGGIQVVSQRSPRLSHSVVQHQDEQTLPDLTNELDRETDTDTVKRNDEKHNLDIKADTTPPPQRDIDDKAAPRLCEGFEMTSPFAEFDCDLSRNPNRSASLPKGINMCKSLDSGSEEDEVSVALQGQLSEGFAGTGQHR